MSTRTGHVEVGPPRFRATSSLVAARLVAVAVFAFLLIRSAWMGDDAFVTLKTVLNTVHGWGVGFNATEVVQGYTSPLWFLIWLFVEETTQWSVLGVLLLSCVLSLLALSIPLVISPNVGSVIVVSIALLSSNAFFEFASGGLENSLAYLLVGLVVLLTLDLRHGSLRHAAVLGLTASAVILTRFDLSLMILPIGLWTLWILRAKWMKLLSLLLALAVPLIIWFFWSFAAYASLLPNTYLAKTNVGIPRLEIVTQGILYMWVSISKDPVTLLILVTLLVVALLSRQTYMILWAVGVFLYLLYVVWVGGDYMAGRFLSVPSYVSLVLLTITARQSFSKLTPVAEAARASSQYLIVGLLIASVTLGFFTVSGRAPTALDPPDAQRWDFTRTFGVADEVGSVAERGWTLMALIESQLNPSAPKNNWLAVIAVSANEWPKKTREIEYPVDTWGPDCAWIADGIVLGPLTHQIVDCPLTDRFLADMSYQPSSPFGWRPGHLVRQVPAGYVDAVKFGDASLVQNPEEAARLKKLWDVIRPVPQ